MNFSILVFLLLKQYLEVYKKSTLDRYRINVRKKKDNEKIEFIEKRLKNKSYSWAVDSKITQSKAN